MKGEDQMNKVQIRPREMAMAPGSMLVQMRNEMDRVFNRFIGEPLDFGLLGNGMKWMPALDVIDGETEVIIQAEVPGIAAKDVDVSISGNWLTLSGKKEESKEEKADNYSVSERWFGSFQRAVELPEGTDSDKVTAEQTNGVLTVRVPKLKAAKPKHVPIKGTN
jgi:HSP20 family protein